MFSVSSRFSKNTVPVHPFYFHFSVFACILFYYLSFIFLRFCTFSLFSKFFPQMASIDILLGGGGGSLPILLCLVRKLTCQGGGEGRAAGRGSVWSPCWYSTRGARGLPQNQFNQKWSYWTNLCLEARSRTNKQRLRNFQWDRTWTMKCETRDNLTGLVSRTQLKTVVNSSSKAYFTQKSQIIWGKLLRLPEKNKNVE